MPERDKEIDKLLWDYGVAHVHLLELDTKILMAMHNCDIHNDSVGCTELHKLSGEKVDLNKKYMELKQKVLNYFGI